MKSRDSAAGGSGVQDRVARKTAAVRAGERGRVRREQAAREELEVG